MWRAFCTSCLLQSCCISDHSEASRTVLSFLKRILPCFPPAEAKGDGGDQHGGGRGGDKHGGGNGGGNGRGNGGGKVHEHGNKHGVPAEAPVTMSPELETAAPEPSAQAPYPNHSAHPPRGKHEVGSPAPHPAHHRKHGHHKGRSLFESLDIFGWGRSLKAGRKHKKHHKGAVAPAPAPGHPVDAHAPAPAPHHRRHHHKKKGSH